MIIEWCLIHNINIMQIKIKSYIYSYNSLLFIIKNIILLLDIVAIVYVVANVCT